MHLEMILPSSFEVLNCLSPFLERVCVRVCVCGALVERVARFEL